MSELSFEVVDDIGGAVEADRLFSAVWGRGVSPAPLMMMIGRTGGYLALARDRAGEVVAASFAFEAHRGAELHSHMTATLPGLADRGVGEALKRHQRRWARDHGFACVTWTFDPLVRRNAWFNLAKLGAAVTAYLPNHYGLMGDDVNADDESDRLLVTWPVDGPDVGPGAVEPSADDVMVAPPDDVTVLRHADPVAARRERHRVRAEMLPRLVGGWTVAGVTSSGAYVLRPPAGEGRHT